MITHYFLNYYKLMKRFWTILTTWWNSFFLDIQINIRVDSQQYLIFGLNAKGGDLDILNYLI